MAVGSKAEVRGGYEEVESITDAGGAQAIISRRVGHSGVFTAAFFRTYERDGVTEKTSFFSSQHFDSLRRVIDTTEARINELKREASVNSHSINRRVSR